MEKWDRPAEGQIWNSAEARNIFELQGRILRYVNLPDSFQELVEHIQNSG